MKDFVKALVKLYNEDETSWLNQSKEILEYFFKTSNQDVKEMIREEFNRLSKEIDENTEKEKKHIL
ncbi:MAG: hypothetical protein J1E59_02555 [Treponema sp.]|nr:hypothetical protein [Treponema sp.]